MNWFILGGIVGFLIGFGVMSFLAATARATATDAAYWEGRKAEQEYHAAKLSARSKWAWAERKKKSEELVP